MIISDSFVWIHFPKCAGLKIASIFEKYFSNDKSIHRDPLLSEIDPTISWHDTVEMRIRKDPDFSIKNKEVICCFRRLPAWLMSRYSFEVSRNPSFAHDPVRLLVGEFLESDQSLGNADYYAKKYLPISLLGSKKSPLKNVQHPGIT